MRSTTATVFRFNSRELAFSFAYRGKALVVVLGDDDKFWVVTMAEAERLLRAGYEWAA